MLGGQYVIHWAFLFVGSGINVRKTVLFTGHSCLLGEVSMLGRQYVIHWAFLFVGSGINVRKTVCYSLGIPVCWEWYQC